MREKAIYLLASWGWSLRQAPSQGNPECEPQSNPVSTASTPPQGSGSWPPAASRSPGLPPEGSQGL